MEIKSGWYLIEQDQLHRVLAHEDFAKLEPDSYVLHQVFDTQREALHEMSRLIKLPSMTSRTRSTKWRRRACPDTTPVNGFGAPMPSRHFTLPIQNRVNL